MKTAPRSVYLRGAEDGLKMGPLLALTVVFIGMAYYTPWLFLPALVGIIAVPSLTYILLTRSFIEDERRSSLSALWLHGICAFFFGGLFMALVAYIGMRWVKPSFIADQFRTVIEVYSSAPSADARDFAAALQKAVDARALPTPIEMALELLYGAVLTGSILSLILSLIIRRRRNVTPPPPPQS